MVRKASSSSDRLPMPDSMAARRQNSKDIGYIFRTSSVRGLCTGMPYFCR